MQDQISKQLLQLLFRRTLLCCCRCLLCFSARGGFAATSSGGAGDAGGCCDLNAGSLQKLVIDGRGRGGLRAIFRFPHHCMCNQCYHLHHL